VDVDKREGMNGGDELGGEVLPGLRLIFLARVVKGLPAGAGDDVDDSLWMGLRDAVKFLVERQSAVDRLFDQVFPCRAGESVFLMKKCDENIRKL
jgi:hypothetical protein